MVTRALVPVLSLFVVALFAGGARAEGGAGKAVEPRGAASVTAPAGAAGGKPAPAASQADERGSSDAAERPRLLHAPVTVTEAHRHVLIYADIVDPELMKKAIVVYQPSGGGALRSVDLLRSPKYAGYVAEIPASDVIAPSLGYTIELELSDGTRVSAFATRDRMHRIAVAEDYLDLREAALAKRISGRRSVVSAEAEFVSFGQSTGFVSSSASGIRAATLSDQYYRAEAAYTFRPLKVVTEFSARLGVLRGQSPVPFGTAPGDHGMFDVGLDYIAPSVRLRLTDDIHADLEFLTGLTEERFRVGALSRLLIGDPYGSKLVLGVQGIDGFGMRFWSRVDIAANDRLMVSPVIEATNFPHADAYGVRLLLEVAVDLGSGFAAVAGGGYQARQATSGGPSAELAFRYAF